jgi:hypothetical protein
MENDINATLATLGNIDEKAEFLLSCMPFIMEYSNSFIGERSSTVFSGLYKTDGVNKGDIYKKFKMKIYQKSEYTEPIDIFSCQRCKSDNTMCITMTSEQVCNDCGYCEYINSDDIGYKEEQDMDKTIIYSYKKENHLNEWICQFQAKESTSVPQRIIDEIKIELKKQKITKKLDITHTKVREILKKLNYNKYYDHAPYITTMVNGIKPPTMSQELEDRLRIMFHQIQVPFEKYRPKDRTNFLSYSYILYKFCELLGEDRYLPCFPLLKSTEKLYMHDQIWKKITTDLRWQFIPTI